MIRFFIFSISLAFVSVANANAKNDLNWLSGTWDLTACDGQKAAGSGYALSVLASEVYGTYSYSNHWHSDEKIEIRSIDEGAKTYKDETCNWGFCDKYKVKTKATSGKNKLVTEETSWGKGPLDVFWTARQDHNITYELIASNTLRVTDHVFDKNQNTQNVCDFVRK